MITLTKERATHTCTNEPICKDTIDDVYHLFTYVHGGLPWGSGDQNPPLSVYLKILINFRAKLGQERILIASVLKGTKVIVVIKRM